MVALLLLHCPRTNHDVEDGYVDIVFNQVEVTIGEQTLLFGVCLNLA